MTDKSQTENPALNRLVDSLRGALGERLRSVVLYGSAARGDFEEASSDLNLILVVDALGVETLEAMAPALDRWTRQGQPLPRLFTPELIAESTDVFPIEFLDIRSRREVLYGEDPFEGVETGTEHLRLQCERELREKMMRLREGYIQGHMKPKLLRKLLVDSYSTFVALFRGCLHLMGGEVPVHNDEVVSAFCRRAELDARPFEAVGRVKHGDEGDIEPRELFLRYYEELTKAVRRVNRFDSRTGGASV